MCLSKGPDNLPLNQSINIDANDPEGGTWYSDPGQCPDGCVTIERRTCTSCTVDSACGWCGTTSSCLRPTSDGSEPWLQEFFQCTDWRFRGGRVLLDCGLTAPADRNEQDLTPTELCSTFEPCEKHTDCHACTTGYWALEQGCVWCAEPEADFETGSCHPANITCAVGFEATSNIDECPEMPSTAHTLAASILLLVVLCMLAL